jgi:hypothetical protein
MTYEHRTYCGMRGGTGMDADAASARARIVVQRLRGGSRELTVPDQPGEFGWGHNGGGTTRAAAAILADALDLGDPAQAGITMGAYPSNETLVCLREDFCEDVLACCCSEWSLNRAAILRWARGWYLQHGDAELPAVLRDLPPTVTMRFGI